MFIGVEEKALKQHLLYWGWLEYGSIIKQIKFPSINHILLLCKNMIKLLCQLQWNDVTEYNLYKIY